MFSTIASIQVCELGESKVYAETRADRRFDAPNRPTYHSGNFRRAVVMAKNAPSAPPLGMAAELLGEQHERLAIDLRVIPFAHRLEIRSAFVIGLPRLPAVGVQ